MPLIFQTPKKLFKNFFFFFIPPPLKICQGYFYKRAVKKIFFSPPCVFYA